MNLVAYRSARVTADTAEALRQLEMAGKEHGGIRIQSSGVPHNHFSWEAVGSDPGPTGLPPALSMRPTGREVYLSVEFLDYTGSPEARAVEELAVLWALAVPLGFLPFQRYPVPGANDAVFHYLGPWATLGDFLHGDGRGDQVWPSMTCAAQCAVGTWSGPRISERSVQTHLHRLGIHCGPVDGMIGDRTLSALRALGLGGLSMHEALGALRAMSAASPQPQVEERRLGHVSMAGVLPEAFTTGSVHTIKTQTGYSVTVDGPGRLILLFGDPQ